MTDLSPARLLRLRSETTPEGFTFFVVPFKDANVIPGRVALSNDRIAEYREAWEQLG